MSIIPLYASLLALLFVALSMRVIRVRRSRRIAIGDEGDAAMLRAMRVHANFAEYVPLCLFMIYLVETQLGWPWLVHALGLGLLLARLSHAWGVSQEKEDFRFRVFGMVTTFAVLLVAGSCLLLVTVGRML